ncbi:MAG: RDD family protein [Pseudomonadales bacterium]|nr:RDD family protein [Pseudomonadales bacterium]
MTDEIKGAPLAGRLRRFAATAIDALLVPGLTVFVVMVTDVMEDAEDYIDNWWILWVFLQAVACYLLLNGYTLWRYGQTLGKRVMGIAIVSANPIGDAPLLFSTQPAPFWKLICIRALFFPLLFVAIIPLFLPLPLLDQLMIFGKRRRCLHDWVSGTVVIRATPF